MYRPKSPALRPGIMGAGMWAWLLQRITGLALVFYLLLHIWVISSSTRGEKAFDELLATLQTPTFVILDLGLLAAILYHGLNGIRIVLFDLGIGITSQRVIFWSVMAASALILTGAIIVTWPIIFRG